MVTDSAENDAHVGRLRRERSGSFYVACTCGWESVRWFAGEAAWANHERHATRPIPPSKGGGE